MTSIHSGYTDWVFTTNHSLAFKKDIKDNKRVNLEITIFAPRKQDKEVCGSWCFKMTPINRKRDSSFALMSNIRMAYQ